MFLIGVCVYEKKTRVVNKGNLYGIIFMLDCSKIVYLGLLSHARSNARCIN
jgi:hypothetical protein